MEEIIGKAEAEEVKISFKNKMMLLAIFGVLLGFVIKTEAAKRITVGFEDYKLEGVERVYNIDKLQKEVEKLQATQIKAQSISENNEKKNDTCNTASGENCNQ